MRHAFLFRSINNVQLPVWHKKSLGAPAANHSDSQTTSCKWPVEHESAQTTQTLTVMVLGSVSNDGHVMWSVSFCKTSEPEESRVLHSPHASGIADWEFSGSHHNMWRPSFPDLNTEFRINHCNHSQESDQPVLLFLPRKAATIEMMDSINKKLLIRADNGFRGRMCTKLKKYVYIFFLISFSYVWARMRVINALNSSPVNFKTTVSLFWSSRLIFFLSFVHR